MGVTNKLVKGALYLGQVVKSNFRSSENIIRVRVPEKILDKNLKMYFTKHRKCYAWDEALRARDGDIVLIRQLPEQKTPKVEFELREVVYQIGEVRDPVTDRLCRGTRYIEDTPSPAVDTRRPKHEHI